MKAGFVIHYVQVLFPVQYKYWGVKFGNEAGKLYLPLEYFITLTWNVLKCEEEETLQHTRILAVIFLGTVLSQLKRQHQHGYTIGLPSDLTDHKADYRP